GRTHGRGPTPQAVERAGEHAMTDDTNVEQRLQLWADELRAIANEGLHWTTENPYDAQRYQRVLRIAAELFATQDTRPIDEIERAYHEELGHLAPYPVADAAVFDGDGRILLIR